MIRCGLLAFGAVVVGVCGCDPTEVSTPTPTTPSPPPPEPPATPTGLMVSDATETSITWTWNAVEGAIGYVVQASTDEMFDDTETVMFGGLPYTTDTSYTASDLEAETTVHVQVAAAAGTIEAPLRSGFTDHVTGMTLPTPMLGETLCPGVLLEVTPLTPTGHGPDLSAAQFVFSIAGAPTGLSVDFLSPDSVWEDPYERAVLVDIPEFEIQAEDGPGWRASFVLLWSPYWADTSGLLELRFSGGPCVQETIRRW